MELWCPRELWPKMNDYLAGLGQLLENRNTCAVVLGEAKKFSDNDFYSTICKLNCTYYKTKRNI